MIAPEQVDRVIFPGSFNPYHAGHNRMVGIFLTAYPRYLKHPIILEISRANRDKGLISYDEITRRIESVRRFGSNVPILLTELPRFVDKARVFPRTLFLVGSDTASRILEEEVGELNEHEAYFAVFKRGDLPESYPPGLNAYWVRGWKSVDVSSTKIREELGKP